MELKMEKGEVEKLIFEMHEDLAIIKLSVQGNGVPGLHDRMTCIEEDMEPIKRTCSVIKWFGGVLTAAIIALTIGFFLQLPSRIHINQPSAVEIQQAID